MAPGLANWDGMLPISGWPGSVHGFQKIKALKPSLCPVAVSAFYDSCYYRVLEDIEKGPETQKDHEHHSAAVCHFMLHVGSGGGEQHHSRDWRY